jgi:hypothetical protein
MHGREDLSQHRPGHAGGFGGRVYKHLLDYRFNAVIVDLAGAIEPDKIGGTLPAGGAGVSFGLVKGGVDVLDIGWGTATEHQRDTSRMSPGAKTPDTERPRSSSFSAAARNTNSFGLTPALFAASNKASRKSTVTLAPGKLTGTRSRLCRLVLDIAASNF